MSKKRNKRLYRARKEVKAPDKVTQKMTADGAILENQRTGETERISNRQQEESYTKPAEQEVTRQSSRLNFTEEERAIPELQRAIEKSDRAADRLDAARANIPKPKKVMKQRVFDEAKGRAKTRLFFEETDQKQNGKLQHRHNLLSRPAQEISSTVHGKIHEVKKENVGVEAGHRGEQAAEGAGDMSARAIRYGYHHHKLKPYRTAAATEKAAAKANADFYYQKALHDNPALAQSNPLSRFIQKQQIKRQYAKAAKKGGVKAAQKAADNTRKAAKKAAEATEQTTTFVVRHWKGCLIVIVLFFMVCMLFSGLSSCSVFGGNGGGLVASSYLSEDADIIGAETAYAAMETELQDMLDNIEREYPGYDEYRVTADDIEHDPYVLASILSAWHEGIFTLAEAQSVLEMLFDRQYILTVTEEVEIRYRTETDTWTDEDGNTHTDTYEVPYEYYILNVELENFNLSHVPIHIMGEDALSLYALYMSTLGNRPDLFPQSTYIPKYVTNPPPEYKIPDDLLNADERFAQLIKEAEKYLNYPYVWGGSNPNTSFDCSGFVSYVLTNSGLRDTGRLGAQGLYNISTRISSPRPGDLVFFVGTYDTPGVSHVGIYVGNGMMLHCGDPIQYSSIETSYWQSHFYAFGRVL